MTDEFARTASLDETGPIDYLVVEFPGSKFNGEAFPLLLDLVDKGLIRILDLVFISKDDAGNVGALTLDQLDGGGFDLTIFSGIQSGLIGEDDITEAGVALDPGSAAGVLVYENVWAAPFAAALRRTGGQLVASGRIPVQAILASLDALDAE
ncbi:DUF6325 family protein [Cellulomonas sp. URHD0024]|uniref:DUF6325 family protein n=1 Tax=Cellulomonas sp. URHD0024 TaxID=1302620 RepID=UPI000428BFD4|nr:DUF6325 family protein [Cellulomonas sp. URHD0024]